MALEFSEIATLGCLFYSKRELENAAKDVGALVTFTEKVRDKVNKDRFVKFGTGKQQFISAMDPTNKIVLDDMCRGISAAIAIKEWLTRHHNEPTDTKIKAGYMTGNVWPSPVDIFKLDAFGMKDYNSSDFILSTGKQGSFEYYYGVSLKKKNVEHAADPTLINKAFDSVMDGREFDEIKEQIRVMRVKWFADKIREADRLKLIKIESNHVKLSDDKLILAKPASTDKSYPNIKGKLSEGYNRGMGFRTWMNGQVGRGDLYKKMMKIIEPHMEMFANQLINLILKVNLNDKLNANRDLDKYYFAFALSTGIGQMRKGQPFVGRGAVYPQESVLCALNHLAQSKKPFVMKQVPNPAGDESNAAKVFFQICKGRVPILDLEVRYKGSFTAQPQFQAFLTKDFKKIIAGECVNP